MKRDECGNQNCDQGDRCPYREQLAPSGAWVWVIPLWLIIIAVAIIGTVSA
jgi:hypothetical protein